MFTTILFFLFALLVESSNLRGGSGSIQPQEQQQEAVVIDPLQSMLAVVRDFVMPAPPTNSTADDIIESTFKVLAEYLDAQEELPVQQQRQQGTITTESVAEE